jgi:hypothetical protein
MLQSKIYAHIGKSAMETYIFAVDIVLVGDGCERHDLGRDSPMFKNYS